MSTLTVTIERILRTLTIGGNAIQVEALGKPLLFTRKPINLDAVCGGSNHKSLYHRNQGTEFRRV